MTGATTTVAPGLDIDAAEKRAAGFRGRFRVMAYDDGEELLEFIPDGENDDYPDDISQFTCDDETQRAIVATLNEAPALIAEVRAARAKVEALTAELSAARGTVGAPPATSRNLFECRLCTASGWSDSHELPPGWSAIANIDGPNGVCPNCAAEPSSLDPCRDEYPNAAIVPADRGPLPKGG